MKRTAKRKKNMKFKMVLELECEEARAMEVAASIEIAAEQDALDCGARVVAISKLERVED